MKQLYHNRFFAMNTRCHVVLPGLDLDKADRIFHILKEEIYRIEDKLSRFIPSSDVATINRMAADHTVHADDELFQILENCQQYSDQTGGAFDITMRPLMDFWNSDGQANEKQNESLDTLRGKLGMQNIVLDESHQTVAFQNATVDIDLGGFGKGYALDRMNELLEQFDVEHAFVSFGESSVLTRGHHPAAPAEDPCWEVGTKNYRNPGKSLHAFRIRNASVSTSANFFVDDEGAIRHHRHVIDPVTGKPLLELATASVMAASSITAEVLSTAVLTAGNSTIQQIRNNFPDVEIVCANYQPDRPEVQVFTPANVQA